MPKQHPNVKALRELHRAVTPLEDYEEETMAWAIRVCEAADNLVNVKGRHHSEVAYRRLEEAVNGKESGT